MSTMRERFEELRAQHMNKGLMTMAEADRLLDLSPSAGTHDSGGVVDVDYSAIEQRALQWLAQQPVMPEVRARRGGIRYGERKAQMGEQRVQMPGTQKPMVSREDYERARAVLDALPAGIYIKCSDCGQWQRGGEVTFRFDQTLCERCA